MKGKCAYTTAELQELLGVSRPVIYKLLKQEEFRWFKVGQKYIISKDSFDAWLNGPSDEEENKE